MLKSDPMTSEPVLFYVQSGIYSIPYYNSDIKEITGHNWNELNQECKNEVQNICNITDY